MKQSDNSVVELKDFYTRLFTTNEVFNIVHENNKEIAKKWKKEQMNQAELSVDVEYIISFTPRMKDLVLEIVGRMKEYSFENVNSLNKDSFNSFGGDSSRYHILHEEIMLYNHTINVVMQMVDMLSESEHPTQIIEIGVLLAFFHDFGKSPIVALNHTEDRDESHHKISANFSKHFLTAYALKNNKTFINDEVINVVYETIYNHHNPTAKESVFLEILKRADKKARDLELRMVKARKALR